MSSSLKRVSSLPWLLLFQDTIPSILRVFYAWELLFLLANVRFSGIEYGKVATIVGRYYAMDRDKRWERVKIAVDGLTLAEGTSETISATNEDDAVTKIEEKYKEDITDEFLKPIIIGGAEGRIKGMLLSFKLTSGNKSFFFFFDIGGFFR